MTEMMVAMAIGSIIMAGILTSYIMTSRQFRAISNYWEIHTRGRYAIDRFSSDIRGVSAISSINSAGPLIVKIPVTFSYTGMVTSNKTVSYTFNNGALRRFDSSTGSTSMLATNIYQLNITMYDRIGNVTTLPANAKGIQLELHLRKYTAGQAQTEDYLSARLNMRNKP